MSTYLIGRRHFLALALAALGVPSRTAAESRITKTSYAADVGILYGMLTFHLNGTIEEVVDRAAGQYRVTANGRGTGIASRYQSTGVLRDGRWAPVQSESWFDIRGRQSRTEIAFDWAGQRVVYRARGETFFLRRLRIVDDTLPLPAGAHVDDVMSATLNYADGRWRPQSDGTLRTQVIRRRRADDEGPDDIADSYRAEIVPFDLATLVDPSGKRAAAFDLSRFSSWAKPQNPARIVFTDDRRPESITGSLILGTSVLIRFSSS